MKKLGGQTFEELDKARGLNKNYNPKLINTTKLEDDYTLIKYLTQKELFEKYKHQLTDKQVKLIKEKINE